MFDNTSTYSHPSRIKVRNGYSDTNIKDGNPEKTYYYYYITIGILHKWP